MSRGIGKADADFVRSFYLHRYRDDKDNTFTYSLAHRSFYLWCPDGFELREAMLIQKAIK